jgi:hypothetical protein
MFDLPAGREPETLLRAFVGLLLGHGSEVVTFQSNSVGIHKCTD